MSKKRVIIFLALLGIIGTIVALVLCFNSFLVPSSRLKAEQEIYSVIFNYLIPSEIMKQSGNFPLIEEYTIEEQTTIDMTQVCASGEFARYITNIFQNISQETLLNFQEINKQSYPLKDYFPPDIYNNPNNQQKTSWRRISFSRIGFDSSLTQALVLVRDCHYGCLHDTGDYHDVGGFFLLHKIDEKWAILKIRTCWIIDNPP